MLYGLEREERWELEVVGNEFKPQLFKAFLTEDFGSKLNCPKAVFCYN